MAQLVTKKHHSFLYCYSNVYVHFFKPGKHMWKEIRMSLQRKYEPEQGTSCPPPIAPLRKGQVEQLLLLPPFSDIAAYIPYLHPSSRSNKKTANKIHVFL